MGVHIYIAGIDRIEDYQKETLQIDKALTYEVDSCQFQVKGVKPASGDEVLVEDDVMGRLFGGKIVKVEMKQDFRNHSVQIWTVDCNDFTEEIDRRLVVETYENISASNIFLDIAAKYCSSFTTTGVRLGAPTIETTADAFNYKKPSECFKWLCDYVGWEWQPTMHKDLQFFSVSDLSTPAPMVLVPGGNFVNGKFTIDQQNLRNRIYVVGGTMLSNPQVVQWKADGAARQWVLPWGPHNCTFTVEETNKALGIENVDDEANFDYMLNFEEKYIRCSAQTATPVAGATVSLTAQQDIDVITVVEDLDSQAAIAAASSDGDDGVREYAITDNSLTTVEAAEAAGNADLADHANPPVSGDFTTNIPGWEPGQIVTIALPDRGITGQYLVQKVSISLGIGFWTFAVTYGGRLKGIADTLKALVSKQQQAAAGQTDILHKFLTDPEKVAIKDELTTTPRVLPYICGDPDAICGLVVVSSG